MGSFIAKLQTSDESVKRRWLIGSSTVIVILVVLLWLTYFNNLVQTNPVPDITQASQGVGFWQTFKGGLSVAYHGTLDTIGNWFDAAKSPSTYEVK